MDILIAIVGTYIAINYIFPAFDLIFEWLKYWVTDKATTLQLRSKEQVKEYELKYPEENPTLQEAIGFHYEQPESEIEDDEEEDYKLKQNKIGFHK